MANLLNLVRQSTTTTGTGTISLDGTAVDGHRTWAGGGAVSGTVYRYAISDGSNYEIGEGTYTSGTPDTLSRDTVLLSSNAGAAISLSGSAEAYCDAVVGDILSPDRHDTLTTGFDSDAEALGTVSSGTVTPEVDADTKENFKTLTNGGAFTLAPPSTSSNCVIRIHVTNNASAGAITTTGFDRVINYDGYATTNAKEYYFYIDHSATRDVLTIREIV